MRRYDGTHVNIASYNTYSYMAGTTISMHVDELVPLTTRHYMAWKGNPHEVEIFNKLIMARASS